MTRMYAFLVAFMFLANLHAQDEKVAANADFLTPSVTALQANTRAFELMHERRLGTSKFTLQGIVGISSNPLTSLTSLRWFGSTNRTANLYISAEPRYYYNLAKRASQEKVTTNNSGNFLGLRVRHNGPFTRFRSGDEGDDVNISSRTYVTPRWGMRRQIGERFDFEVAVGANTRLYRPTNALGISIDTGLQVDWKVAFRF